MDRKINCVYPQCFKCQQRFLIGVTREERLPYLLNCGHSMCSGCLVLLPTASRSILCILCKKNSIIPDGGWRNFPIDVCVYGEVTRLDNDRLGHSLEQMKSNSGFRPGGSLLKTSRAETKESRVCRFCNSHDVTCVCFKCKSSYCDSCFLKKHNNKPEEGHEAKVFTHESPSHGLQHMMCSLHNKELEFICLCANVHVCSTCVLRGNHRGHNFVSMQEQNTELSNKVNEALMVASMVKKKLKGTIKNVSKYNEGCNESDCMNVVGEVITDIHRLIGLLLIRKTELLKLIEKESKSVSSEFQIDFLHDCMTYIKGKIEDGLKMQKGDKICDGHEILSQLQDVINVPCSISSPTSRADSIPSYSHDSLDEKLSQYGTITRDTPSSLDITASQESADELIKMFESSGLSTNFTDSDDDEETKIHYTCKVVKNEEINCQRPTTSNSSTRQPAPVNSCIYIYKPIVRITHIETPSRFWICYENKQRALMKLTRDINRWISTDKTIQPKRIEIGDLVLGLYINAWYRARVVNVFLENGRHKYYVLFIDYGNSENLSIHDLRKIPEKFTRDSPLAILCSLAQIVPKSGQFWSRAAVEEFAKIVADKQLEMQIYRHEKETLIVDLGRPASVKGHDSRPTSVKDALVFMSVAAYFAEKSTPYYTPLKYLTKEKKRIHSTFTAKVMYFEHPFSIFVQELDCENEHFYNFLIPKMQQHYRGRSAEFVNPPMIGDLCAHKCHIERKWRRAELVDCVDDDLVEIKYIDYGDRAKVPVCSLRVMDSEFLKLPMQAIEVALAHIEPKESYGWDSSVKGIVMAKVYGKTVNLTVMDIQHEKLMVKMVVIGQDHSIQLNSYLVRENLATSHGICSVERAFIPKNSNRRHAVPKKKPTRAIVKFPLNDNKQENGRQQTHKKVAKVHERQMSEGTENAHLEKQLGLIEVVISHFDNPGCFYVQILNITHSDMTLVDLMRTLSENCSNPSPPLEEVIVGQLYAVKSADSKWYRANVLNVISQTEIEVRMVDYGFQEMVHIKDIQSLTGDLLTAKWFAMACCLDAIQPAGGSNWTCTSCDMFKQFTKEYRAFIVKKGEVVNGLLPIDLNMEETIEETALEPSRKQYFSLATRLRECGLCLPSNKEGSQVSPVLDEKTPSPAEQLGTGQSLSLVSLDANDDVEEEIFDEPSSSESEEGKSDAKYSPPDPDHISWTLMYHPHPEPSSSSVSVRPVHVDTYGIFYAYSSEYNSEKMLNDLNMDLELHVAESHSEGLHRWAVGQACLSMYPKDWIWCRAVIQQLTDTHAEVFYIDYGNTEWVLRKYVSFDIEPFLSLHQMTLQFTLANVEPLPEFHGQWSVTELEFIQEQIVAQNCTLKIVQYFDEATPFIAHVYLPDGRCLSDVICDAGYGRKISNVHTLLSVSEVVQNYLQSIKLDSSKLPECGRYFPVTVTHMELPNIVHFQHYAVDDADYSEGDLGDLKHIIMDQFRHFEYTVKSLNDYGTKTPAIPEPIIGDMHCVKYQLDNSWYRGDVLSVNQSKKTALVLLVDFGQTFDIEFSYIKPLPNSFKEFPRQSYCFHIRNLEPSQDVWSDEACATMTNTLSSDCRLFARISSYSPCLKGDLFLKDDNSGNLLPIYTDLLHEKLASLSTGN